MKDDDLNSALRESVRQTKILTVYLTAFTIAVVLLVLALAWNSYLLSRLTQGSFLTQ